MLEIRIYYFGKWDNLRGHHTHSKYWYSKQSSQ